MAWVATLHHFEKRQGMIFVRVTFTDGVEVIEQEFHGDNLNADTVAAQAKLRIDSLIVRDAAFDTLIEGIIEIKEKTAEELEADAFFVLLNRLNALLLQVDKQIIARDDEEVTEATNAVKAAWKPEYELDFRFR